MADYCLVDLELADGSRGDAGITRSQEDDTWRITWVETPEEREGYE